MRKDEIIRIAFFEMEKASEKMEDIIEDTKTSSGTRDVPMTSEVAECFHRIIDKRKKVKVEPMIDDYSGFLYLDKNNMPMVALHREKCFQHVVEKYNGIYKIQMPKKRWSDYQRLSNSELYGIQIYNFFYNF